MSNRFAPFVVALEEHYWDIDLVAHFPGREGKRLSQVEERLQDITTLRIKEMDEAGIDVQVLSHGAPDERSPGRNREGQPEAFYRLRHPADAGSEGRRRRTRSHCHEAWLQGRYDPRP